MRNPLARLRPGRPRDLDCNEVVEIVTDYIEGAMDNETARAFERHLDLCEGCANYLDQMRETIRLTGTLRVDDLMPEARAELIEAFRGWKER